MINPRGKSRSQAPAAFHVDGANADLQAGRLFHRDGTRIADRNHLDSIIARLIVPVKWLARQRFCAARTEASRGLIARTGGRGIPEGGPVPELTPHALSPTHSERKLIP